MTTHTADKVSLRSGLCTLPVLLLLILIMLIALFLTACTQAKSEDDGITTTPVEAKYAQTIIDYPEGVHEVLSLEKTSDGKIWMVGTTDHSGAENYSTTTSLWELNQNNSWDEVTNFNELLGLEDSYYVIASHITKNDQALYVTVDNDNYSAGIKFYLIDPKLKNYRELMIDTSEFIGEPAEWSTIGSIAHIYSLSDDRFLIKNGFEFLFVLDVADETIEYVQLEEDTKEWHLVTATELDETVYVLLQNKLDQNKQKVSIFDISSGAYNDLDSKNDAALISCFSDSTSYGTNPMQTLKADDDLKRIIFAHSDGIFEYRDHKVKKLANAEDTILSDPSQIIEDCLFENQDDFLLSCSNYSEPYVIYKYEKLAVSS